MPKRSPMKKYKYDKDPLADIKEASKEIKKGKNPQPVIDYVLKKLGTPENLVKVEAFHYDWGEGRDNRWRVNVVTEEMLETDLGNLIPTWKRHNCYFLRFDDESQTATYCNPPIEKSYNSKGELIDGPIQKRNH